ncbi:hypothetical protein IWZ01DRAFT_477485 [Phyllosticta capitalensis]
MSPARPVPSASPRDTGGISYSTQMLNQEQDGQDTFGAHAYSQIQPILQSASRLVWPDGFQANVIEATKTLHFDLRRLLQLDATMDTYQAIENHCSIAIETLDSWARRNQVLSRELSVFLESISEIAHLGAEERLEIVETKEKTMPMPDGCEVNTATARGMLEYFLAWIAIPITLDGLEPYSRSDRSIYYSLLRLEDRLHDVVFSAEQLQSDFFVSNEKLSRNKFAALAAIGASKSFDPDTGALIKTKRYAFKQQIKKILGIGSKITKTTDSTTKESSHQDTKGKRRGADIHEVTVLSPARSCPRTPSIQRPRLFALPLCPLPELVEIQRDISCDSQRFDNPYMVSESSEEIMKAQETRYHVIEHTTKRDSMLDSSTRENIPSKTRAISASQDRSQLDHENSGLRTIKPCQPLGLHCKRAAAIHSDGGGQITKEGKELLKAVGRLSPNKSPDKNLDPEATRSWHRRQALKALEGGVSDQRKEDIHDD